MGKPAVSFWVAASAASVAIVAVGGFAGCSSAEESSASELTATAAPGSQPAPASQPAAPAPAKVTVPEGAKVFFVAPADTATVTAPETDGKVMVPVVMGAEGIAVKPAGVLEQGAGHHHIIVDGAALAAGAMVPKNDTHLHYGKGQTEATLALTPGKHTLVMQFADGMHQSYGEALSAKISIEVAAGPAGPAAPTEPAAPAPAP